MSNKFTYIIRSPSSGNTNSCDLNLRGLPSKYKYLIVLCKGSTRV